MYLSLFPGQSRRGHIFSKSCLISYIKNNAPGDLKDHTRELQWLEHNISEEIFQSEEETSKQWVVIWIWKTELPQRQLNITFWLVKKKILSGQCCYTFRSCSRVKARSSLSTLKLKQLRSFPHLKPGKSFKEFQVWRDITKKFCPNFSDITCLLTNFLSKNTECIWTDQTENVFNNIKAIILIGRYFSLVIRGLTHVFLSLMLPPPVNLKLTRPK